MKVSLYSSVFLLLFSVLHCHAVTQITRSQPLFQNQTLVSSTQVFELGFFTPDGSENQYIGIWYKNKTPSKIIWVANREKPIAYNDRLAALRIGGDGNLKLLDGQDNLVWSANASSQTNDSYAVLSNLGNFILQDANSGNILWQSFDNPTDTLLPGMQIGTNSRTGVKNCITSWKSDNDPMPGNFSYGISPEVPPQCFIWKGSIPHWRSGQWDRSMFIGMPYMDQRYVTDFSLEQDPEQGTAFLYIQSSPNYPFSYTSISSEGHLEHTFWEEKAMKWVTDWEAPRNSCDTYGICGPYGICNALNLPICSCLKGFKPKSSEEWTKGNWTSGCIRESELNCQKNMSKTGKEDGFLKIGHVKLPDHSDYLTDIWDTEDCQMWCLNNCSCMAYSYVGTIGCMVWSGDLIDIQEFSMSGEDLFLRLPDAQAGGPEITRKLVLCVIVLFGIMSIVAAAICLGKWRYNQNGNLNQSSGSPYSDTDQESGIQFQVNAWKEQLKQDDASKMQIFDFDGIVAATNNFSITNKLGQGAFGPVYKGKLTDGKEVAVKRLSSSSSQGMEEFKTEISLISKLQHRNLVRLIGCCIEQEEKILVYKYLPNKSLDSFLFDWKRKAELTWDKRFRIIQEIARGLLYLHRDSCLRVIHRDLKVSNILLDEKLNPKISDFGLARMFQGTQDLANTCRVVGTFGYISPEYAMGGIFSEKSDVYSFGVLVLEIVSGKKNTSLSYNGEDPNLLSYAWQLWREGREFDLLDETIACSSSPSEAMKCIQIGLLCVQDHAADRPNMSAIVLMLSGEMKLPQPKEPTFTFEKLFYHKVHSGHISGWSKNIITDSFVEGR